jgi:hypothetical protein
VIVHVTAVAAGRVAGEMAGEVNGTMTDGAASIDE